MLEKWREKLRLEISGGERTLHVLYVDDVLLDRRDWGRPQERETKRGGGGEGGIRVGFREKYRAGAHQRPQPSLAFHTNATGWTKCGRGTFLKEAREKEIKAKVCPPCLKDRA